MEAADPAGLRAATPAPWWAGLWTTDGPGYDMEEVAELVSRITPKPRDWFDNLTDFFAGMGDLLSFGGTKIGRGLLGVEGAVDTGSGWYTGGQIAGAGVAVGIGGVAGARIAGRNAKFAIHPPHHGFPGRGPSWHVQLNWWQAGVKGSGRGNVRRWPISETIGRALKWIELTLW